MDNEQRDQYTFLNPADLYSGFAPETQHQPEPGLDAELEPKADLGEKTYRGTGRLAPAYVFLASPESSYVAGATIAVTGGSPTP
ncbi:hypothetical protein [Microbacterium kyungheense]|uniref:Enoyl-ACP reductase-like protein n=1 Tax=Microbacterium kyungheense TaxID=1263636 RepID=A0A543EDJ5_9MICO|nr:hypothetical protein FB391_3513 [Microbacterium kyungheense]